jgi:hypothetical protein
MLKKNLNFCFHASRQMPSFMLKQQHSQIANCCAFDSSRFLLMAIEDSVVCCGDSAIIIADIGQNQK